MSRTGLTALRFPREECPPVLFIYELCCEMHDRLPVWIVFNLAVLGAVTFGVLLSRALSNAFALVCGIAKYHRDHTLAAEEEARLERQEKEKATKQA